MPGNFAVHQATFPILSFTFKIIILIISRSLIFSFIRKRFCLLFVLIFNYPTNSFVF